MRKPFYFSFRSRDATETRYHPIHTLFIVDVDAEERSSLPFLVDFPLPDNYSCLSFCHDEKQAWVFIFKEKKIRVTLIMFMGAKLRKNWLGAGVYCLFVCRSSWHTPFIIIPSQE